MWISLYKDVGRLKSTWCGHRMRIDTFLSEREARKAVAVARHTARRCVSNAWFRPLVSSVRTNDAKCFQQYCWPSWGVFFPQHWRKSEPGFFLFWFLKLRIFRKSTTVNLFLRAFIIFSRQAICYRYMYKYPININYHLQVGHSYRYGDRSRQS